MCERSSGNRWDRSMVAHGFARNRRVAFAAVVGIACALLIVLPTHSLQAAANPAGASTSTTGPTAGTIPLTESLGVHFIPGSSSTVLIERDGKTYLLDLADRTIQEQDPPSTPSATTATHLESAHSSPPDIESGAKIFSGNCAACHGADGKGVAAMKTPDFTNPTFQAALSKASVTKTIREGKPGTAMPAWGGKLSEAEIAAVAGFVQSLGQGNRPASGAAGAETKQVAKVYVPADDYLFSLPTGRQLDRHGFYFNFTHRFVYTPAFSGTGGGDTLGGLDDFSISSFGFRYGITDKLSVSAYRSPA